jgi:hypothetical protein
MPPVAKSINKPANQAVPTLHTLGARISQNMMTNNKKSGLMVSIKPDHGNNRPINANNNDK